MNSMIIIEVCMWEEAHELTCSMFVIEVYIWEEVREHRNIFIIEVCMHVHNRQECTINFLYPPAIEDIRHRNHTTLDIQRLYS